jgi:hypothetical protein
MRKTSTPQLSADLRVLGETGNASLAAAFAGVSREWAYKRRKADARFAALCREMVARFRRPPLPSLPSADIPPLREERRSLEVCSAREGRGAKRVQVRRDRLGGWTDALEARFVERLRETCSVPFAAAAVGLSAASAYRRRNRKQGFAAAWDEAERDGWPPVDVTWIEAAVCFFEGREPPPGNPVRIGSLDDVLEAMKANRFVPRRPRGTAHKL